MIEILQIIFQLFLFIFLTSFPINKYLFLNLINASRNIYTKNLFLNKYIDTGCNGNSYGARKGGGGFS